MARRLAALLAASGLILVLAAPALAVTEPLNQATPIAWNDPSIEVECDADDNVPSGMVLWHFIAHTSSADFTLTADFDVDSEPGNEATFDVSGMAPTKTVDLYTLHWEVTTPLGTLVDASITGSGSVTSFNLSHVCPNPGEIIPEAPASALLVVTAVLL